MNSDTAFTRIARPAGQVFAFLADPENLSLWSFGTWHVEIDETGLIKGRSIKDGSVAYVRIHLHPETLLVDYLIGSDPAHLTPRIFIRLAEGPDFGGHTGECALMMTALRTVGMDDDRWASLKSTHAVEVGLIKSAVETGYDHRTQT